MKIALNASARDAQLRDSFNKESFVTSKNNKILVTTCQFLYELQAQLPRNASKLHSLVVVDDNGGPCYLLNFEVLRNSLTVIDDKSLAALCFDEFPVSSTKLSTKKRSKETANEGGDNNDN